MERDSRRSYNTDRGYNRREILWERNGLRSSRSSLDFRDPDAWKSQTNDCRWRQQSGNEDLNGGFLTEEQWRATRRGSDRRSASRGLLDSSQRSNGYSVGYEESSRFQRSEGRLDPPSRSAPGGVLDSRARNRALFHDAGSPHSRRSLHASSARSARSAIDPSYGGYDQHPIPVSRHTSTSRHSNADLRLASGSARSDWHDETRHTVNDVRSRSRTPGSSASSRLRGPRDGYGGVGSRGGYEGSPRSLLELDDGAYNHGTIVQQIEQLRDADRQRAHRLGTNRDSGGSTPGPSLLQLRSSAVDARLSLTDKSTPGLSRLDDEDVVLRYVDSALSSDVDTRDQSPACVSDKTESTKLAYRRACGSATDSLTPTHTHASPFPVMHTTNSRPSPRTFETTTPPDNPESLLQGLSSPAPVPLEAPVPMQRMPSVSRPIGRGYAEGAVAEPAELTRLAELLGDVPEPVVSDERARRPHMERPCIYFTKGTCIRGDACRFLHICCRPNESDGA